MPNSPPVRANDLEHKICYNKNMFVFFDLDRTLLDFETAEAFGIKTIFDTYKNEINMTWNEFLVEWKKWAQYFFDKYSAKELTFEQQRNARVAKIFELNGNPINSQEEQKKRFDLYNVSYQKNLKLFDDALPFLQKLRSKKIGMGLITNGDSKNQREKIKNAGIQNFFEPIIISAEVGFSKPNLQIFKTALQQANVSTSNTWYIGDSLQHDIEPAKLMGLSTVYLNRLQKENILIEESDKNIFTISANSFASLMDFEF